MTHARKTRKPKLFLVPPDSAASSAGLTSQTSEMVSERYEMPALAARALIYILAGLLAAMLIWAALSKIDVIAEAPAIVIPRGDVKIVQPQSDGVIAQLLVREGENVTAGTRLILLDRTPYQEELSKQEKDLEIGKYELEQHRLARTVLEEVITNPGSLPAQRVEVGNIGEIAGRLYASYNSLREAKYDMSVTKSAFSHEVADYAALKRRLAELKDQRSSKQQVARNRREEFKVRSQEKAAQVEASARRLEEAKSSLGKVKSILAKTKEQQAAYKSVFEQGALSRIDYLGVEKQVESEEKNLLDHQAKISELTHQIELARLEFSQWKSEEQASLSQLDSDIKQLSADIAGAEMQMRELERKFNLSSSSFEAEMQAAKAALQKETAEIAEREKRVNQLQSQVNIARYAFEAADIKAPVDGVVTGIKVRGPQQVVAKGEQLMTIVPLSKELWVEAQVANKDVGFVRQGQRAKIKVDAFPFQDYGIINGIVQDVEAHAEPDQQGGSVYKVHILPERSFLMARGKKMSLVSGMTARAEIVLRKRSILQIILEPINKLQDMGIQE